MSPMVRALYSASIFEHKNSSLKEGKMLVPLEAYNTTLLSTLWWADEGNVPWSNLRRAGFYVKAHTLKRGAKKFDKALEPPESANSDIKLVQLRSQQVIRPDIASRDKDSLKIV